METANVAFKDYKRLKNLSRLNLALENWYYENFRPDFTMEYHTHPQLEIMYCENGGFDFVYKSDDDKSYSITVNKNCFIIVNTGYFHKLANVLPQTKIINLEFLPAANKQVGEKTPFVGESVMNVSLDWLSNWCLQLKELIASDKNYYLLLDEKNVSRTMKDIIGAATSPQSPERALYLSLLTTKFFMDVSHCVQLESHVKTGLVYVDTAMVYINSHFLGEIKVSDVADHVKISVVYLQRLFKEKYGKTVYDVIIEKRIMQAKYLLEQSNLTTSEISAMCGFNCREQLIYNFRKAENCSPADYKKKNAGKNVRSFSNYGEFTLYETE